MKIPVRARSSRRHVAVRMPDEYPEQKFVNDLVEDEHGSVRVASPSGVFLKPLTMLDADGKELVASVERGERDDAIARRSLQPRIEDGASP